MNKLKKLRQQKKFTLEELAKLTGLSRMTIFKIEKGIIKNPSSLTLQKLAKALDVSIEELFDFKDTPLARR